MRTTDERNSHAPFSPSASNRWINCPASWFLKSGPTSEAAEKGTAAHKYAEALLKGYSPMVVIEEDYREMAEAYVNYAKSLIIDSDSYYIETPLVYDFFLFGTPDLIVKKGNTLQVVDFKAGRVPVDPDSTQLKIYASIFCQIEPVYNIELIVFQPMAGGVKTCKLTIDDILEFFDEAIEVKNFITKSPDAAKEKVKFGKHCRYCSGLLACEAAAAEFTDFAVSTTTRISNDTLSDMYSAIPVLKAMIKQVEDKVLERAIQGQVIKGFELIPKRTHRRWKDVEAATAFCEAAIGEPAFKKDLRTPAQVEKILKKGENSEYLIEKFLGYIEKPKSSKLKKVNDDDMFKQFGEKTS